MHVSKNFRISEFYRPLLFVGHVHRHNACGEYIGYNAVVNNSSFIRLYPSNAVISALGLIRTCLHCDIKIRTIACCKVNLEQLPVDCV